MSAPHSPRRSNARRQSSLRLAAIQALENRKYLTVDLPFQEWEYEGNVVMFFYEDADVAYGDMNWGDGTGTNRQYPDYGAAFSHEYADNASPGNSYNYSASFTVYDQYDQVLATYDPWTIHVQNYAPTATIGNSGPINEGGTVTVSFTDGDDLGSDDDLAGLKYTFATSVGGLAVSYETASSSASATFSFNDEGTPTIYGRVYDQNNGYNDYSTQVTVTNVAPYATLTFSDPDSNGTVTVSLTGANDPGSTDTFKYSFSTVYANLAASYSAANSSSSQTFTEAQLANGAIVYARIFDNDNSQRPYSLGVCDMSAQVVSSSQINTTWTDNATNELGWRVQWSDDGSFGTGHVWYVNLPANTTHYDAINVPDGTRRWFRTRAYSDGTHPGESIYSPKMAQTTYLPPPVNLVASNVNHSSSDMDIEVTWDVPSQNHTGFVLKRFAEGANVASASPLETQTLGSSARSYTFENYEPGDVFQYTLKATGTYTDSIVAPVFENRTLHPGGWMEVDNATGEYYTIGSWTPYTIDDSYYGPETVEYTLSNIPQHSYLTVDIFISVSTDDPLWPNGYDLPVADANGETMRVYEDGPGFLRIEIAAVGAGLPDAFKHESSQLKVTIDASILPAGSTWSVMSTEVWAYFPLVGFTYDVSGSASESGDGILTVGRFGAGGSSAEDPMTISLDDLGGSASMGSDYNLPGSVTIPAGQTSATVHFGVLNDADPEWTEDTTVRIPKKRSEYSRGDESLLISDPHVFDRHFEIVDDDLYMDDLGEVRMNDDDDNGNSIPDMSDTIAVSGEDDLFSIFLDLPDEDKDGSTVVLAASAYLVRIWENSDRSGTQFIGSRDDDGNSDPDTYVWECGENGVPNDITVWVEFIEEPDGAVIALGASDAGADAPRTPLYATMTQASTQPGAKEDLLVVLIAGHNGALGGPGPTNPAPAPGTYVYSIENKLIANGVRPSSIYVSEEEDAAQGQLDGHTVAALRVLEVITDRIDAAHARNATLKLAIVGYSHGGGLTWWLANELESDPNVNEYYDLIATTYIDGIEFAENGFLGFQEIRRPPASDFHMNFYQTRQDFLGLETNIHGAATSSGDSPNIDLDQASNVVTHLSIDDATTEYVDNPNTTPPTRKKIHDKIMEEIVARK